MPALSPIDLTFDRSSLPVGVSGRLDPANPVYGNTATLTLSADSNLTEGSRSIEISGTGERAEVRPTTVTLNTSSSGSGGGGGGGGGGTGVRSFALRETVNDILRTEIAAVQNRLNYFGETRVLDAVLDTTEGVPVNLIAQTRSGKPIRGNDYIPGGNYGQSQQTQNMRDILRDRYESNTGNSSQSGQGQPRNSSYEDITRGSSIRNISTNATLNEFRQNLLNNGFIKRVIQTAKGNISLLSKGSKEYIIRPFSKSGPSTADYKVNGAVVLKIRLK